MHFLKTLFWVVVTAVVVVFSINNWYPAVQVSLWGGYEADTQIRDLEGRPLPISRGRVIHEVLS